MWRQAMQRQALAEWRDRHILQACALFNEKACEARQAFESLLTEASVVDSVWDPAGFAHARIDRLLEERITRELDSSLAAAAAELRVLDERFSALAAALSNTATLTVPEVTEPAASPREAEKAGQVARDGRGEGWLARARDIATIRVLSITGYASQTAEWLVQDKVGLRDRIRAAADQRIATRWMGLHGEPRPVLAQVMLAIDDSFHEARTSLV